MARYGHAPSHRSPPSFITLLALSLSLVACGHPSCKSACEKLKSCGFSTSGLSCDDTCSSTDGDCATCVVDNACGDLSGKCTAKCPKDLFTKK